MPKKCTCCGEEKSLSAFYNRSGKASQKNSHCKECEHKQIYEWRKNNPDKQKIIYRRARLKAAYGLTLEQYDELLAKQNNCCAICDRHESSFPINLSVDHDHKTGEIRGLLCTYCNHRVVGRHRDGAQLRKVADYIEQGTGLFVPEKKKRARKRKSPSPKD